MTQPPDTTAAKRARLRAERAGWAKPLEWDLNEIDDPDAKPYEPSGIGPRRGFAAELRHFRSLGFSDREIAKEYDTTLDNIARRIGRRDAA